MKAEFADSSCEYPIPPSPQSSARFGTTEMGAGSMNVCTLCVPAKEVTRYLVTHRRLGAGIFSYAGCLACNDVYTYSNRCSVITQPVM